MWPLRVATELCITSLAARQTRPGVCCIVGQYSVLVSVRHDIEEWSSSTTMLLLRLAPVASATQSGGRQRLMRAVAVKRPAVLRAACPHPSQSGAQSEMLSLLGSLEAQFIDTIALMVQAVRQGGQQVKALEDLGRQLELHLELLGGGEETPLHLQKRHS